MDRDAQKVRVNPEGAVAPRSKRTAASAPVVDVSSGLGSGVAAANVKAVRQGLEELSAQGPDLIGGLAAPPEQQC